MGINDERFQFVVTRYLTPLCTYHAMPNEYIFTPSQLQKIGIILEVMKLNEDQLTWFFLFFKTILK
jgi:hypothetical protein